MNSFLEVSLVFMVATVFAFVVRRLRIPLIVGYLLTGVLIGPLGLGIIEAHEHLQVFSQLGIAALLFIVGLTLSPHVLREIGKPALSIGIAQGCLTSVPAFFLARFFDLSVVASLYVAAALTLSSTIVVSKILSDKKWLGTLHGKLTIGFLLVQDVLAAVALLISSSLGEGHGPRGLAVSFGITAVFFLVLYGMSTKILPKFTPFFAKSQDILFLFSLGWGIGIAGIFSFLGLSFELGALAAGMTLAPSPYHHELGMRMRVVRDFFLVVFFALLGSQLATPLVQIPWGMVAVLCLFVCVGKPLIVLLLMRLRGFSRKVSFLTAISIAQISEFSFILIALGVGSGHIPSTVLPLMILVGILTIAASSLFLTFGERLYGVCERWLMGVPWRETFSANAQSFFSPNIILIGCHRTGAPLLPLLARWKKPYVVVDFDPGVIKALQAKQIPCVYGDASEQDFLEEIGIKDAEIVISTIPDHGVQRALLRYARKRVRSGPLLFFTAASREQALSLYAQGASQVIRLYEVAGTYTASLLQRCVMDPIWGAKERRRQLTELKKNEKDFLLASTDIHHRWSHLHE